MRWKIDAEYFAKISKNAKRKHTNMCHVSMAYPSVNNNEKFNYLRSSEYLPLISTFSNLFCVLLCATVWYRFPCFQMDSFCTLHISTQYITIHQRIMTLLPSNLTPLFCSEVPPCHVILLRNIKLLSLWLSSCCNCLHKTHFCSWWELFAEYFE